MKKSFTRRLAGTLAGFLLLLPASPAAYGQQEGDKAPDFSFSDLEGNTVSLSDFKGKAVFLFLFGNGCPYCQAVGNDTETMIHQAYRIHGDFQAIGLDLWDASSSVASVTAFRELTGITYPLLLKGGEVSITYGTTYDRAIVVDQSGNIAHKGTKSVSNDLEQVIETIESLLAPAGTLDLLAAARINAEIYPNPAAATTKMVYRTGKPLFIKIILLDITGKEINVLKNEWHTSGQHTLQIDTSQLDEGIYFVKISSEQGSSAKKLAVIR